MIRLRTGQIRRPRWYPLLLLLLGRRVRLARMRYRKLEGLLLLLLGCPGLGFVIDVSVPGGRGHLDVVVVSARFGIVCVLDVMVGRRPRRRRIGVMGRGSLRRALARWRSRLQLVLRRPVGHVRRGRGSVMTRVAGAAVVRWMLVAGAGGCPGRRG